ncbi:MAG: hypothetical protein ACN6OB_16855 [Chryseobacterium jejuense]|uniref:hypothetical protein n=1 Tax=Chryseobacterium jejuense TaxID=445960 RepID=UPI003D09E575
MKILLLSLLLTLSVSCASQNIPSYSDSNENDRRQEFIQQRSNEAAGKNIYQGSGLQIYKRK